jgi:hypothetical protein
LPGWTASIARRHPRYGLRLAKHLTVKASTV